MRLVIRAMLLMFVTALAVPSQAQQAYVWNGTSLSSVPTTEGLTCSNWTLWYFKRGASQTPGTQWGAEIENSAEKVLKNQQDGEKFDNTWAKWLNGPPDQFVHNNYLGPICETSSAFDATPDTINAIEKAGELAGRVSNLIGQIRSVLNGAESATTTGYQGYYLQESNKNQLQEFLDRIQEISEHVHKLQNELMQRLGPTMMQINADMNTVTQQLAQAEHDLPSKSALVSPNPVPSVSTAWMSKIQTYPSGKQCSFQQVPGGIAISISGDQGTTVTNIQFSNIKSVLDIGGTFHPNPEGDPVKFTVFLKNAVPDHVDIRFANQQDAQDAYNFLHAQIQ
jgi:prefoldin subunit 5